MFVDDETQAIIIKFERERIAKALEDDVQVNGTGAMMMEHIIAIVREGV